MIGLLENNLSQKIIVVEEKQQQQQQKQKELDKGWMILESSPLVITTKEISPILDSFELDLTNINEEIKKISVDISWFKQQVSRINEKVKKKQYGQALKNQFDDTKILADIISENLHDTRHRLQQRLDGQEKIIVLSQLEFVYTEDLKLFSELIKITVASSPSVYLSNNQTYQSPQVNSSYYSSSTTTTTATNSSSCSSSSSTTTKTASRPSSSSSISSVLIFSNQQNNKKAENNHQSRTRKTEEEEEEEEAEGDVEGTSHFPYQNAPDEKNLSISIPTSLSLPLSVTSSLFSPPPPIHKILTEDDDNEIKIIPQKLILPESHTKTYEDDLSAQRSQKIKEIEKDMQILTSLFRDVSTLVQEQTYYVDILDDNIEKSGARINQAKDELNIALFEKVKIRKRHILLFFILSIIFACVVFALFGALRE